MVEPGIGGIKGTAGTRRLAVVVTAVAALFMAFNALSGKDVTSRMLWDNIVRLLESGAIVVAYGPAAAEAPQYDRIRIDGLQIVESLVPVTNPRLSTTFGALIIGLVIQSIASLLSVSALRPRYRRAAEGVSIGIGIATCLVAVSAITGFREWLSPDWQTRLQEGVRLGALSIEAGIGAGELQDRMFDQVYFYFIMWCAASLLVAALQIGAHLILRSREVECPSRESRLP